MAVKVSAYRCLYCRHHFIDGACACSQEDVEQQERDYLAGPAPRQFPKSTGVDWFREDRTYHRMVEEERDD